jgi:hypothetical protein
MRRCAEPEKFLMIRAREVYLAPCMMYWVLWLRDVA